MAQLPASLDDLQQLRTVARGRLGTSVILCRQQCGGDEAKFYALKKMPRATASAKRAFGEKAALQAVRHRHIVRFFRTFKDDEHLYFLLEFVRGGPLYRHARRAAGGRVAAEAARFWTAQLVLALRELRNKLLCRARFRPFAPVLHVARADVHSDVRRRRRSGI